MRRSTGILAMLILVFSCHSTADQGFGRYRCQVEEVYGVDELGKTWKKGDLFYDADAGTLDGSFDPGGHLDKEGLRVPPGRLFSRLKVETPPSKVNNLVAVQYDPATTPGFQRPIVAWLMLQTMDSTMTPRFQFFSNTIRGIAVGRCVRDL